jgi:hypothetical protein
MKKEITYAFIVGQNFNKSMKDDIVSPSGRVLYQGSMIDYKKFRMYLSDKYGVNRAVIFVGYLKQNDGLYKYFQHCGFEVVFKKTTVMKLREKEKIKGNVDIDIAVYAAARWLKQYDKAIFISGDGDFLELYDFIEENNKLHKIMVPNSYKYSRLLRKYQDKLIFVNQHMGMLVKDKKRSASSRSRLASFSGRNESLGFSDHRDDKNSVAQAEERVKTNAAKRSKK